MKAHRARRDSSEREIIDVLERRGFCVRKLAQKGVPDLLVWPLDRNTAGLVPRRPHLVEVKTGKGKLRETQQWAALGLDVTVLRTAEEAMLWNR